MDRSLLTQAFRERYERDPEIVAIAPGRVNLIGEHTDYNDGFVFPAAIDRGLLVAACIADGPSRMASLQLGGGEPFEASSVLPGELSTWSRYAAGMAWVLREHGPLPDVLAMVHSDIPIGSGVSSSAALELAFGTLYNDLAHLGIENKRLAVMGQRAENDFVGVRCGIMDQMASAMGKEGCALFLDTRTLDILYARIPADLAIVLLDTKTPRELTESAYNERRSQCEQAARDLGVPALRDVDATRLEQTRMKMDPVVYRRARHVVTENARCRLFVEALNSEDEASIGNLMRASHESLRHDYEVSSKELDAMAEAAWAAPGCVGARMMGAGFGGACIALVRSTLIEEFSESVNKGYQNASGLIGETLVCRPVDGARVLWRR